MRPRDTASVRIVVCVNERFSEARPSCAGRGSRFILEALAAAAAERGETVSIDTFECFGRCEEGPNLRFSPGGPFLRGVHPEDAVSVLDRFLDWRTAREAGES